MICLGLFPGVLRPSDNYGHLEPNSIRIWVKRFVYIDSQSHVTRISVQSFGKLSTDKQTVSFRNFFEAFMDTNPNFLLHSTVTVLAVLVCITTDITLIFISDAWQER